MRTSELPPAHDEMEDKVQTDSLPPLSPVEGGQEGGRFVSSRGSKGEVFESPVWMLGSRMLLR